MTAVAQRPAAVRVRRGGRAAWAGAGLAVVVVAVLGYLPLLTTRGTQVQLVGLFSLVVLGTMWNLLAGYGGMVSIGQQAYIGIGGYGLVYLASTVGVDPFLAVPVAAVVCAVVAWPISYLAFRLAGGYFAIGTWVIAEVVRLLVTQVDALGAGSGASLTGFAGLEPTYRIAYVYWMSLGIVVLVVGGVYLLMRSRLGLALTAIRDEPTAAGSLGVAVTRAKRLVYVAAAAGCGLAGAMVVANTLRVQPGSAFSVDYSAMMIFIVVIGGIGTIEGPIIGALVFYALQDSLADLGNWYLVVVGVVAIAVTLLAPRGLWGLTRGRVELFPTGYRTGSR
ncbi:branched-chain amino acid ABC transporter permease [Klenkia brasiliensis]|uniref:Branched-chain amino acid transport system permease protein n=1 Tax=Klenkia brasiliensis TaxID=333142 RepID=A0A1G7WFN1_9ACTN|nr:branched-chain amino acid ABC transporter permease [Klenkia brasiliensis]SDG70761.1 branched-chain amino acid transport system permease protein [Klenkia brasiliensis]